MSITAREFADVLKGRRRPSNPRLLKAVADAVKRRGTEFPPGLAKRRRLQEAKRLGLALSRRPLTEEARRALAGPGLVRQGRHYLLEEYPQACGLRIEGNRICGVRVLGYDSLNRRRYSAEAVRGALAFYEGIRVNIDHPARPTDSRSMRDRFGRLVNVAVDDDGLVADLEFNPEHELARAVVWFAENMPEAIGLSHNAVGEGRTDSNGVFIVQRIARVRSVDLVADPATTSGLAAC